MNYVTLVYQAVLVAIAVPTLAIVLRDAWRVR